MKIVVWGGGLLNNRKPEDLKRFNKNKKQKQIIIGSIIAIVLIIGGISLYRSFAMYEEKASFDVLKGTVPDFSTKDINLAFTIDGQTQTNTKFPNKGDGYIVEEVSCEDNVTATWNSSTWSLENIENKGEAKKVKCTVAFKTSKGEPILNGADPVLGDGMIPVTIGEKGEVTKVKPESGGWYSYEDKEWANAVILTESAKSYEDNEKISEEDIESYFVWIPKYSYRLFDEQLGKYTSATGIVSKNNLAIEIRFGLENTKDSKIYRECETPMLENKVQGASGESGNCHYEDWMTHPAFLAFGGNGLWVGKFETSNAGENKIQIKPNATSWLNITMGDSFRNSQNYMPKLQSHNMKNTEWGAVAYLTQSIYGRCENENNCTEVSANTNSYKTGYTGNTAYGESSEQLASTTGNYSGIYDMNGGVWEQVASVVLNNLSTTPIWSSSGLSDTDLTKENAKYYDVYNYGTDHSHWERRILGDATGEVGPFAPFNTFYKSSMWDDIARLAYSSYPWIHRGGFGGDGVSSGVFAFSPDDGRATSNKGFRIVLATK